MFKNLKKVLFALVVALLAAFTFACGDEVLEANKENCKDFCETCKPEANGENCKEFCEVCGPEANDENCQDFQNFVAPTDFYIDVDDVKVGETVEVFLDEFEPENAYQGLTFVSSNPEYATVDAKGVVTGIRPGNVTITATSVLDPEVSASYDFEVEDALSDLEVIKRELEYLKSLLPNYVTETYEFPQPWNTNAVATYTVNGKAVDKLEVAADLAGDIKNSIGITVTYNDDSDSDSTPVIWTVKDAKVNSFTRIEKAVAAADALMGSYALAGEKVTADLTLPATIFGCTMNWASSNPAVIASDGKYVRPLDDKAINLSINATFGDNIGKGSYNVIAKGYDADEKAAYILANTFANLNGKEVNTDLVLPEYDGTFGAKLTYKSSDTTIYADNGKLVAAPAEAKEVKFTVTVDYAISAKDNFKKDIEVVVKAVPATEASKAVNAWLATEGGKKYAAVAHTPYGLDAANLLDLPTEGYKWNVEAVKLAVKDTEADPYQALVLAADGKVKLNAQYLRYTLVNLTGVYTHTDGSKANVSLFLNIGVSATPMVVYTGTWRSSDQGDGSLTEIQGKYDLTSNVSYFDKEVGYVKTTYGSGYWSGYVLQTEVDGQLWESYVMEMMTVYVEKDKDGNAVYNVANVNGGTGGNWGVFFVNKTGEPVNIEVGTYGTSSYKLADGNTIASVGSRNNLAIDGYAPGFVVDGEGNVIHKSTDDKLEYNMENNQAYIGGKQYKEGDVIDSSLFDGMADEFKVEGNWEAVYTVATSFKFEANAEGTYKKVTAEDGTVTYEAIAEGEEVAEKFAPKYAKGAAITADEYAALTAEEKANITVTYKALKAIDFTVKNLLGDSAKGTKVHYLTIPAGGYAMSWKYQFYGVGAPTTLRAFTQGTKVTVKEYDVHYLNCKDGEYAADYLAQAEGILAANDTSKNASAETYVNGARNYYAKLEGATKADVFAEAELVAAETALAALVDKEITDFLAAEATMKQSDFATTLGTMNNRFEKYTEELEALLTKKADFDAKFEEYAKIDLFISYDYQGGYAQGYIYDNQKSVVMPMFLKDLYDHMVAQGAFQHKIVDSKLVEDATLETPTFEVFSSNDYWATNYSQYAVTILSYYLYTPAYSAEGDIAASGTVKHENYHDYIEGATTFFNTERGQYWIALADWVNEATQYANGSGQDFWGRNGEPYVTYDLLAKQSYYNAGTMYKDPTGINVNVSGTLLGAYRFAQYVCDSSLNGNYKTYIPNKVWSTVFDRQTTQEQYGTQIYHCTDATVKLLDEPYREGYKFLGWVFEDGSEAVITGAMFKDVTVYAKWAADVEGSVEEVVGTDLTPVYYGAGTDFRGTTPAGETVDVQAGSVGVGDIAVVVGDKLFPLPAKAYIELGKDAAADATLAKTDLMVYGATPYPDSKSNAIVYSPTDGTAISQDSYGHGAMYYNAGQFNLTFELSDAYGRDLNTAGHGYKKVLFTYDAEKKAYIAKDAGTNGSFTLKPGEYLWCPMTAERYCTGLTICDGSNGVAGVLSDGCEVQIVKVKLGEAVSFATVKFVNAFDAENPVVLSVQYNEPDVAVVKPADLELYGYNFLGWATSADATEAEEVAEFATADVTYYAVWKQLDSYAATTVNPNADGSINTEFTTIKEALNRTLPGGTITVATGSYTEALNITAGVTIIGPNADKAGSAADRVAEAEIKGAIVVSADNVTLKGLKFTGDTGTTAPVSLESVNGFVFTNNFADTIYGVLAGYANNRRSFFNQPSGVATKNVIISNNKFDYATHGDSTYLKWVIGLSSVDNIAILNNEVTSITNAAYLYNASNGVFLCSGNTEGLAFSGKQTAVTPSTSNVYVDAAFTAEFAALVEGALFTKLDDAIAAVSAGGTITVNAGEYALEGVISKSVTIKGASAETVIINVKKDVAGNLAAANITFDSVTLKGQNKEFSAGVYFQFADAAENFTVKNCIITEMNTFIKQTTGNGANITVESSKVSYIGQFFIWSTKESNITVTGCAFDLASGGFVTSQYAAIIRARGAGKLTVMNNVFDGDVPNNPGLFEAGTVDGLTAEIKYNTFKGTTKFVYANDNRSIVFDCNLYLDAEGNVLTAAPAGVSGAGVTADVTVCTSAEDLAAKYAAFLTPAE